ARQIEIDRVTKLKEYFEGIFPGLDLRPTSEFWDFSKAKDHQNDTTHVRPFKLVDGDNFFDFKDPFQELTFSWLRVHPAIAPSYQSWERKEVPHELQWYVADEDVETEIAFKKKSLINKAIVKFEEMTPDKRKMVAR